MKTYKCVSCEKEYLLDVTKEQIIRHKSGELAQNVFTNLSANERELIISGICGECYDEMFMDEDEMEAYLDNFGEGNDPY